MESQWVQASGTSHWTVGVEIQPDVPVAADHPHLKPAKQEVVVHQDLLRDISRIRVNAADNGTYRLLMLNSDLEYTKSAEIVAGGSAKSVRNAISGFYKDEFGVDPIVDLSCEVSDGTIDDTCAHVNVTDHIYEITIPKSINRPSCPQVMVWKNTTVSEIEFIYSNQIQLSTPPLLGAFYLECGDLDGNVYRTNDMDRSADTTAVYNELLVVCPWLRDSVTVWNGRDYYYSADGIDFIFYYGRFKGTLPQINLRESLDTPLVGTNVTILNDLINSYGPDVYYDVIPFEQLYTYNTAPQVRASVDGMPVLCAGTQCGFTYEAPLALITGMTTVGLDVQITGTDLPLEVTKVQMAFQDCMVTNNDATQISCSLSSSMSAGSWIP